MCDSWTGYHQEGACVEGILGKAWTWLDSSEQRKQVREGIMVAGEVRQIISVALLTT